MSRKAGGFAGPSSNFQEARFEKRVGSRAGAAPLDSVVGGVGVAVLLGFGGSVSAQGEVEARNVILMIGNGMGPAQRDAGQLATVGSTERLVMDSLPYTGRVVTNAADPENSMRFTGGESANKSDSSSSGTAFALLAGAGLLGSIGLLTARSRRRSR